jgi:hypothetical protein
MKPSEHDSKFGQLIVSEALKMHFAQLYYHIEAMCSIAKSLLEPSRVVDLKIMSIYKFWEKKSDSFTVLASADLINRSVGFIELIGLIQTLENEKNSLKRILDEMWPNWENEVKPPLLINDLSGASRYSDPLIKKEILRATLEPLINKVLKVWRDANELVVKAPILKALVGPGLDGVAKLFNFM